MKRSVMYYASFAAFAALMFMAACGLAAVTPAQVVADLTGVVTTLQRITPMIVAGAPTALSADQQANLADDLAKAKAALGKFAAGLPAKDGASVAATIDGYINDAMDTLAFVSTNVPALAPYATPIAAIDVILPEVEAFVNSYLPTSVTTTPTKAAARLARAIQPKYTPDEARAMLNVPVVHQ